MKYRKGFVANSSSSSFIYKIKIPSFVKEDQLEEFIEFTTKFFSNFVNSTAQSTTFSEAVLSKT